MAYKWTEDEVRTINDRRRRGDHRSLETLLKPEPKDLVWPETMPKHRAIKADWTSAEILVSGSLNSAKTTVTLDKELDAVLRWPGIPILLFRWTEESLTTKLRPAWEQILQLRGIPYVWDREQHCYHFDNGSRVYAFGLKAVSEAERMNKLRGLGVCRILGDQVEECQRSVAEEVRGRLRPDLTATVRGVSYPYQLTFVCNPSAATFWLSKEFPEDNSIEGRTLYELSLFDNTFLPPETIASLLRTWPPAHPKHQTMILGRRGLNIVGNPVYEGLYDRTLHARPLQPTTSVLLEAYEVGKHNPCWVVAQRTHHGALHLLGGVLGQELALEDFLRVVRRVRADWYPGVNFRTTASPVGEKETHSQARVTLLDVLREWNVRPLWRDTANAPDVELAMIEELSGYLRRRTPSGREESFGLNTEPDRWLVATREDLKPEPWMSFAFEGGYVWDEEMVSVAHKRIKRAKEDDHFSNAMRCVENLLLSFCMGVPSDAERTLRHQHAVEHEGLLENPYAHLGPLAWMAL